MSKDETNQENGNIFVVGIAASAGGLEAASLLAQNLPKSANAIYVLAQHMSPTHKSLLTSLISRETELPVVEIEGEVDPEPNTIYVTPPNSDIVLQEGKLLLLAPSGHPATPKPSADRLFKSMAKECGEFCVGVVLSGTGSDGSYGVQAIREAGGVTIAQDTSTAKYDGMPASAIETGCIDLKLTPEQIGVHLEKILSPSRDFVALRRLNESPSRISDLLQILLARTNVDFREYKENTVNRRISRRMAALDIDEYEDYVAHCRTSVEEVEALYRDLLISVTRFFRDPKQFEELQEQLDQLVRDREYGQLRIWVAGCATGEEAYSIAILLAEALGGPDKLIKSRIQIFATDIDDRALEVARAGSYPITAANDVPKQYLEKYFRIHEGRIEVTQALKAVTLFSQHNLVQDPPFINVDFISLRNVLIYFNTTLQERVLNRLHYALVRSGLLFLGTSESVGALETLFEMRSGTSKVYSKRHLTKPAAFAAEDLTRAKVGWNYSKPSTRVERETGSDERDMRMFDGLARAVAPTGFIATRNNEIIRVFGDITHLTQLNENAALWLSTRNLRAPLRDEITGLIATSIKNQEKRAGRWHDMEGAGFNQARTVCYPISNTAGGEEHVLVSLQTREDRSYASGIDELSDDEQRKYLHQMELEVVSTREALQQTVEELQTTNEELQSINEEMQSTNEELQATNEELETSNEELQSTNEELITVNEELQVNSTELQLVSNELAAVLKVVPFPALVIDHALIIRRASWAAMDFFGFGELPKVGLHLSQCRVQDGMPSLSVLCNEVFTLRERRDVRVDTNRGAFHLSVTPFKDQVGDTMGLVLTLVEDLSTSSATIEILQSFGGIGHWQLDLENNEVSWSDEVYRIHGVDRSEPVPPVEKGLEFYHPDDRDRVRGHVEDCIKTLEPFHFRARLQRRDGRTIVVESAGSIVLNELGNPKTMVGVFRDVTKVETDNLLLHHIQNVQKEAGIGFYSYDIANDLPHWSDSLHQMLGFDPKTHVPTVQSAVDIIHPEDRERVQGYVEAAISKGEGYSYDARLQKADGEVIPCHGTGMVAFGTDGAPTHIYGTFTVTE